MLHSTCIVFENSGKLMVRLGCVGFQWSILNLINLMKEAIKNGLGTKYRTKIDDCQIV